MDYIKLSKNKNGILCLHSPSHSLRVLHVSPTGMTLRDLFHLPRHPHLCSPLDLFQDQECTYLVYPHYILGSLDQDSTSLGFDENTLWDTLLQLLLGMNHLHQHGLGLGSLSLENIMMGNKGILKIQLRSYSLETAEDLSKVGKIAKSLMHGRHHYSLELIKFVDALETLQGKRTSDILNSWIPRRVDEYVRKHAERYASFPISVNHLISSYSATKQSRSEKVEHARQSLERDLGLGDFSKVHNVVSKLKTQMYVLVKLWKLYHLIPAGKESQALMARHCSKIREVYHLILREEEAYTH